MKHSFSSKQMRCVFQSLAISLGLIPSAVGASTVGSVDLASIEAWKRFRAAQPFQTQVIAVSPLNESHARTLIFSEPPPKVTWEKLTGLLAPYTSGCTIQEWFVMSGGSVKDVVCTLKKDVRDGWADRLAELQLEAYGTTEGAPIVALPVPTRRMIAHSLDLRYSARDLYVWLMEANQLFTTSPIAPSVSLQDLLQHGARGVFWNPSRTLVLWVIDRGGALNAADGDIRRFAIGSDLVLGAVASKSAVVIVGRGRLESLAHLPPLRSETVLLLAGTVEDQLAQSYERRDVIAGKSGDGVDRAPILLSPQLVDTEFGTLLNVSDQLLKGWSMAGHVRYVNFRYPAPKTYPFGSTPASNVQKGRSSFLFNWNTDGAAYRQTIDGFDVVVPQRTGSLSVIYGDPRDRPRDMENIAYDYFAKSGDTSLVRVLQYTLLFQIFRQFDVRAPKPPVSPRYAWFATNIQQLTRRQLKFLLSAIGEHELNQALLKYWTEVGKRIPEDAFSSEGVTKQAVLENLYEDAVTIAATLRQAERASQGKVSDALADVAAHLRRRVQPSPREIEVLSSAEKTLANYLSGVELAAVLGNEAEGLRRSGLLQVAADKLSAWKTLKTPAQDHRSWNHTAYTVESRGEGPGAAAIGGHNLNAPLVRFSESLTQAKGKISAARDGNGQWVVTHSAADGDRLRDIARQVGMRKELTKAQIESEVGLALKNARAELPVAIRDIRAVTGKAAEFKSLGFEESAYRFKTLTTQQQKLLSELSAFNKDAIVLEQLSDGGFMLSRTGSPNALHVASITAATDALANGLILSAGGRAPVSVFVKGVPDAKAEAMLSFVQSNLRRYPKQTVEHVLSTGNNRALLVERPALVNAKIAHNGIRIDHNAIKVEKVTSGAYKGFSRVEVPVTIQAKTPVLLRLIFFVKDLTAATKEALLNKVASVLASLKGPVSIADANLAIRKQLKSDLRELGVDSVLIRIDNDATRKVHDVIIAVAETERAGVA